jgi:hypothetical protein
MHHRTPSLVLAVAGLVGFLSGRVPADTTVGSCLPSWELTNFQPASPTFLQAVKSSSYFDRPAVIVLLSAS